MSQPRGRIANQIPVEDRACGEVCRLRWLSIRNQETSRRHSDEAIRQALGAHDSCRPQIVSRGELVSDVFPQPAGSRRYWGGQRAVRERM